MSYTELFHWTRKWEDGPFGSLIVKAARGEAKKLTTEELFEVHEWLQVTYYAKDETDHFGDYLGGLPAHLTTEIAELLAEIEEIIGSTAYLEERYLLQEAGGPPTFCFSLN